jgi:two-component system response regulator AlgR
MSRMPLRVLIVDDEAPARSRLRDLLSDLHGELPVAVREAATPREALDIAAGGLVDVALLDIRMPGMDGIELAGHLQQCEPAPALIFTTAYDGYAIRAFELHALDYLLKPIRAARLRDALLRAAPLQAAKRDALRTMRPEARTHLSAAERGRVHLIAVDTVIFLRAELKYVTVRTAEREYLIEESLVKLEQEFAEQFVRVHRNCLVARTAITGFERAVADAGEGSWQVLLRGIDDRLPVSRRQQHIVRELARS